MRVNSSILHIHKILAHNVYSDKQDVSKEEKGDKDKCADT